MSVTDPFTEMVLIRTFHTLDMAAGTMVRHEVRRDPATGLTLTRKQPVTATKESDDNAAQRK